MDTVIILDQFSESFPSFRVCVQGNGTTLFESLKGYITDTLAHGQVSKGEFNELLLKFDEAKFFSSLERDLCDSSIGTDRSQYQTITARIGQKQKQISYSMKCGSPGESRFYSLVGRILGLAPITFPVEPMNIL
jgi:hypothetical protein